MVRSRTTSGVGSRHNTGERGSRNGTEVTIEDDLTGMPLPAGFVEAEDKEVQKQAVMFETARTSLCVWSWFVGAVQLVLSVLVSLLRNVHHNVSQIVVAFVLL